MCVSCRQVLECLREHVDELSAPCSKLLFRRQQQSLILPKADYFLFSACKGMILKYCASPDLNTGAEVLDCLKVRPTGWGWGVGGKLRWSCSQDRRVSGAEK